jgi:hypothetical protein
MKELPSLSVKPFKLNLKMGPLDDSVRARETKLSWPTEHRIWQTFGLQPHRHQEHLQFFKQIDFNVPLNWEFIWWSTTTPPISIPRLNDGVRPILVTRFAIHLIMFLGSIRRKSGLTSSPKRPFAGAVRQQKRNRNSFWEDRTEYLRDDPMKKNFPRVLQIAEYLTLVEPIICEGKNLRRIHDGVLLIKKR